MLKVVVAVSISSCVAPVTSLSLGVNADVDETRENARRVISKFVAEPNEFTRRNFKPANSSHEECGICLEKFAPGQEPVREWPKDHNPSIHPAPIHETGCGHRFHFDCIFGWTRRSLTNPGSNFLHVRRVLVHYARSSFPTTAMSPTYVRASCPLCKEQFSSGEIFNLFSLREHQVLAMKRRAESLQADLAIGRRQAQRIWRRIWRRRHAELMRQAEIDGRQAELIDRRQAELMRAHWIWFGCICCLVALELYIQVNYHISILVQVLQLPRQLFYIFTSIVIMRRIFNYFKIFESTHASSS